MVLWMVWEGGREYYLVLTTSHKGAAAVPVVQTVTVTVGALQKLAAPLNYLPTPAYTTA